MQRTCAIVSFWTLGLVRSTVRGVAPLGVTAAALVALAGSASADVTAITPKFVVAANDNAKIRASDGTTYYSVRSLKSGDVLKADGEGGGWMRVEYPAGTRAYVKAMDAAFDDATKTLKLIKSSKLMAANELGARPWCELLRTDLPVGMTFSPAEAVKAADGTVDGYLIPAPAQARGFVRAELVRAATPEEAATYGAVPVVVKPAETKPVETKPVVVKPVETPKPVEVVAKPVETPKVEMPAPTPPAPAPEIITIKPVDTTPDIKPADIKPETVTMTETRTTPPAPAPKPALTKRVDDINLLREMFDRVMKQAENESELATVVSEFNRKIDAMPMIGDDAKIRVALEQRREALYLRQEVIEVRRKMRDNDTTDERLRMVRVAVENAEKQSIYTIVGRILPSTVYDGKRGMPMMYRVESADFSSTRTIGYVVPREGVDLLPKMGKIVGIVGDAKMDPALGLNLVAPMRVDELQVMGGRFEPVPGTSTGVTPTPAPTPSGGMTPGASSMPVTPGVPVKPIVPEKKDQPVATPEKSDTGEINK